MKEKNSSVQKINNCEVCLSKLKGPELDFGEQPLCDELTTDSTQSLNVQRYHQNIVLCELCFTAHQKFQVPKRELFKPNYHYRAALTKDVLDGMEELVNSSSNFINFNDESTVLDVGCNDGSLLNIFKKKYNVKTIGVDPTDAIDEAENLDLKIKDYFDSLVVEKIKEKFKKITLITFTNVFAHIEDLNNLLLNLKELIDDDTVIIIENHYLGAILNKNQFDTFYHEHPRTYSVNSFKFIADRLDIKILDIMFPKRYAGNIRVILSRNASKDEEKLQKDEFNIEDFVSMQTFFEKWKENASEIIYKLTNTGETFNGKSLPGRGVMLINSLNLSKNFMPKIFEQNHSPKVGNFVPGTEIYIDKDKNLEGQNLIIWSWHILDEIINYLEKTNYKGTIWTPLPEFKKVVEIN